MKTTNKIVAMIRISMELSNKCRFYDLILDLVLTIIRMPHSRQK